MSRPAPQRRHHRTTPRATGLRRRRAAAAIALAALTNATAGAAADPVSTPTPSPICVPSPPFVKGLQSAGTHAITDTTATITWIPQSIDTACGEVAPTSYEIATADHTVLATVSGTSVSATLTGLSPATTYTVHVHSVGGNYSSSGDTNSPAYDPNSPDVTFTTRPASVVTPTPIPTPTPDPDPTPTPTPTGNPDTTSYAVAGTATLKNLAKGSIPLSGSASLAVTSIFNPGSPTPVKSFAGELTLAPAAANLKVLGFLPVTATIQFAPTAPLTGSAGDASTSATLKTRIKLPSVKAFGIQIGGGASCQTTQASTIPLSSSAPFLGSVTLAGTFAIGNLSGCGALNGIVSPLTAGSGNALALTLTQAPVATPAT
ncbi:MAG: fibronectin type III domain-containing protein [Patulibacter sp.]|nr:fibronectin type III domain-containing protein [Patulibacter sp.]